MFNSHSRLFLHFFLPFIVGSIYYRALTEKSPKLPAASASPVFSFWPTDAVQCCCSGINEKLSLVALFLLTLISPPTFSFINVLLAFQTTHALRTPSKHYRKVSITQSLRSNDFVVRDFFWGVRFNESARCSLPPSNSYNGRSSIP